MLRIIKLRYPLLHYYFAHFSKVMAIPQLSFSIKRVFTSLYMLVFLNGLLVTSLFYTYIEATYDANIFTAIVSKINQDSTARVNSDTFLMRSMRLANSLQQNRYKVFGGMEIHDFKGEFLRNSLDDLLTGRGCCGSASSILLRLLQINGYEVRFAQMKVGNIYGGHIVIEARKEAGWMVIDPLFNCYFKKPNGQYASFNDVMNNWSFYKKQLPADYPQEYQFEDVRYTNWTKFWVPGLLVKKALDMVLGKVAADQVSLRVYLIRNYHVMFIMLQIIFIPLSIITVKKFRAKWSHVGERQEVSA